MSRLDKINSDLTHGRIELPNHKRQYVDSYQYIILHHFSLVLLLVPGSKRKNKRTTVSAKTKEKERFLRRTKEQEHYMYYFSDVDIYHLYGTLLVLAQLLFLPVYYCSDVDIYHLYGTVTYWYSRNFFFFPQETRQCMYVGSIPVYYHCVALEVNSWFTSPLQQQSKTLHKILGQQNPNISISFKFQKAILLYSTFHKLYAVVFNVVQYLTVIAMCIYFSCRVNSTR